MDEKDLQHTSIKIPETKISEDPLPDMEISTLRTYKNDISHTVSKDKISTAKIMLAEQKAQEKKHAFVPETSVKKPKNIVALLLGLLFTIGAIGVIGFFVYIKIIPRTPNIVFNTSSFFLFAFDNEEFVDVKKSKSETYDTVDGIIREASLTKEGEYTDIVFHKAGLIEGEAQRIIAKEFFDLYDVQLPTNIGLSISDNFAYGLYKTDTGIEPFIVIGLVDFENAFASMFAWEPTLALDMKGFFPNLAKIFTDNPEVPDEVFVDATTTMVDINTTSTISVASSTTLVATSTSSEYKPINRNVQFIDVVLANRDTRALRDENGTPYFYYAFIDKDKILFAQDSRLIAEIVRKVREKQLVR